MTVERPKPAATGGPSMFRTAVEAAAAALPDAPDATVEQVVLAVLRVALPLHETQHADAWKAAHERAVHFELEALKANERAEKAEAEAAEVCAWMADPYNRNRIAAAVQRAYRQRDEAVEAAEAELEEYKADLKSANAELERYRGVDAAAKELLARNVELGTRADNAKAKCEDLEGEVERLREQVGKEEISWAACAGYDADGDEIYHSTAEKYAHDAATKGIPVTEWVTRVYPTAVYGMELDESGEWREVPDA